MSLIQEKLELLIINSSQDEFIFDFLSAYNTPKSTIARLKKWDLNKIESTWELLLRKKILYKQVTQDLYAEIDTIKNGLKENRSKPRFVIVTDFKKLLAYDTKVLDSLDVDFKDLPKHYDFFNPLLWIEKQQVHNENQADIKAAVNLAKLYDEIVSTNEHKTDDQRHALNIFLSRLLFCYFAEDTNIFENNQFTSSLASHTKLDGSDTDIFLEKLFKVFNSKEKDTALAQYLSDFPYVNGKLFAQEYHIPKFTTKSRKLLIELWELNWSWINPDIFGSMMQAVMDSQERGNMGSHYTSVPNIMKVINPLFLDELYEELDESIWNTKKLNSLLDRISQMKFFDPACGSWNFLIIAYKEIRRFEIEILKELWTGSLEESRISLSQFYGIELHDFAHETAKLSLYLAEHQMNIEFYNETWISVVSLPLKLWWNIVCWNATRLDWETICPKKDWEEVYVMGNPPYYGSRKQTDEQKKDLQYVFRDQYKTLDYIAPWFYLGSQFIKWTQGKLAFVSTNSITQWEQVSLTWPRILKDGVEINFAYKSFKWKNNAKDNANVIVVIIGLTWNNNEKNYLFKDNLKEEVDVINPYLWKWVITYVYSANDQLFWGPEMNFWNMPADGWKLLFTPEEKDTFTKKEPLSQKFFKPLLSAHEFLNWKQRWCLWLEDITDDELQKMPLVMERVNELRAIRLNSSRPKLATIPHLFAQITQPKDKNFILIPRHSSERRAYIPMWYFTWEYKAHDSCLILPVETLSVMWFLSSRMHMVWVKAVCWRLKSDYRYSKDIVYNTFPFPYITKKQRSEVEGFIYEVLDEREKHTEKTLSEMYDPDKMPEWLKSAHHELDLAIERCYRPKPFTSDEERLEYLFKMYDKMIAKKNAEI